MQQYDVEVRVDPPECGFGVGGRAEPNPCSLRMAQVFEEKPHLRRQLVDILRGCPEDSALKMQASTS